jgi:hypothetical protein
MAVYKRKMSELARLGHRVERIESEKLLRLLSLGTSDRAIEWTVLEALSARALYIERHFSANVARSYAEMLSSLVRKAQLEPEFLLATKHLLKFFRRLLYVEYKSDEDRVLGIREARGRQCPSCEKFMAFGADVTVVGGDLDERLSPGKWRCITCHGDSWFKEDLKTYPGNE